MLGAMLKGRDREIRAQPHREQRGHFLLGGSSLRLPGGSPRGMQRAADLKELLKAGLTAVHSGRTNVRHRLRSAKTSSCEEEEEVKGEELQAQVQAAAPEEETDLAAAQEMVRVAPPPS